MKNNSKKLLALLCAGCIAFGGCGGSDTPKEASDTAAQNQTEENADNKQTTEADSATDINGDTATTDMLPVDTATADAVNTESTTSDAATTTPVTGSSATDTTLPSATPMTDQEIPKPHATATADTTTENPEEHTMVGIVTDATEYSISVQVPDGSHYHLTIPETGVEGNLNYITIGQLATLKYVGSLDENHATLTNISDSSMVTGIYVEEYAFALKIINACKSMDMEALSDLSNFPVFLETGKHSDAINTSGEFEAIDTEKIFTEALVTRMANFNLFDLQYTDAGFVMGRGTPSITFDVDDEGILGIIGINCNAEPLKKDTDKENKDEKK